MNASLLAARRSVRYALVLLALFAAAFAALEACSLNPQPIPPGLEDDGGGTGVDAGLNGKGTGGSGDDSDAAPIANADDGGDGDTFQAGLDGGDGGTHDATDGGDASLDASDAGD